MSVHTIHDDGAARREAETPDDKKMRHALAWMKEEHNALCGDPKCDSVYCFIAAALLAPHGRGIYVASRSKHGARWRSLRDGGLPIIATWINEYEQGATEDWSDLWERCVAEARDCAALVLYAPIEDGELKGALVEVGAALAVNRRVYFVGDGEARRYSWLNHPYVTQCSTVAEAFMRADDTARAAASALPAPGHTDMMVSPESIDEYLEKFPPIV